MTLYLCTRSGKVVFANELDNLVQRVFDIRHSECLSCKWPGSLRALFASLSNVELGLESIQTGSSATCEISGSCMYSSLSIWSRYTFTLHYAHSVLVSFW